jgi:AraC-like DNA-binding protein
MGWLEMAGGSMMTIKALTGAAGCAGRSEAGVSFADDGKVIRNEFLSSFGQVVRGLGGDPDSLMLEAGIEPSSLFQPGGEISLRATASLLENAARVLNCPDLGLRLAERQNGTSIMKPLDRLLSNAPTVGESMYWCMCYMGAFSSGICATLDHDTARQMHFFRIELMLDGLAALPQMAEQIALLTYNAVVSLSGGAARPREIWFSHLRVSRARVYAQRFGIPVKFGQAFDGVFLKDADFNTRIADGDPGVFVSETRTIAARFTAQPPGIEIQVRQAIGRALAESECTREQVAASLGIHSRTLQRRLRKVGLSFEAIRDEVRRNLAVRYLARSDLRLTEIVGRLGYSEPAVLSRSCRRWFAATPSELRRSLAR